MKVATALPRGPSPAATRNTPRHFHDGSSDLRWGPRARCSGIEGIASHPVAGGYDAIIDPVDEQQTALNRKLRGHYQYYGRSTNLRRLQGLPRRRSDLTRTISSGIAKGFVESVSVNVQSARNFDSDCRLLGAGLRRKLGHTASLEYDLSRPMDWSPDGRFLLYRSLDLKTRFDLWAFRTDGDRKPFPVLRTNFDETAAQFSPDGKWIAYQSNESGHYEIYLQPFPGLEGKFQISTSGGAQPRWRKDGKELFYIGLDDRFMAVPIQVTPDGKSVQPRTPVPLFLTHVGGALQAATYLQQYAIAPDGRQFLMNNVVEGPTPPITVILNWKPKP